MIELNLLPPEEKSLLQINQIQRWVVFYGSAVLSSLLIFIILLAVIWFSIFIQAESIDASLDVAKQSQQGQKLKTQQDLTKELNVKIERINQFQKNHKSYSTILFTLAKIMPSGTRLDRLTIDEKNKMTISGYASRREELLELKDSLEKSDIFAEIDNPLANLIKQANINFSFTMTVKNSGLNE